MEFYIVFSRSRLRVSNIHQKQYLALFLFCCNLSVSCIRKVSIKLFSNSIWPYRPCDAYDCNYLCNNGRCNNNPGFPSGHVVFATTLAYMLYNTRQCSLIEALIFCSIFAYTRYVKKCHTIQQVLAGVVLGVLYGKLYFLIKLHKVEKKV